LRGNIGPDNLSEISRLNNQRAFVLDSETRWSADQTIQSEVDDGLFFLPLSEFFCAYMYKMLYKKIPVLFYRTRVLKGWTFQHRLAQQWQF
jgi:hypothetical protein